MKRLTALALTTVVLCMAPPRRAEACGGSFFLESEASSVTVTDHRMAISISDRETIIWDQIKYTGAPSRFAFLFPVTKDATVELGDDAWFTALDAYTAPTIFSPRDISKSGCALMGCGNSESETAGTAGSGLATASGNVIGPYVMEVITPKSGTELTTALTSEGFDVAAGTTAVFDAYLAQGLSFLSLRLRPGCGERAIQPIRIVMPGSHPTLPLRLASAGVDETVNLEIFVLANQRYAPMNYPVASIDFSQLRTEADAGSNYEPLADAVFATGDGRSFITEFAGSPNAEQLAHDPAVPDQGANQGQAANARIRPQDTATPTTSASSSSSSPSVDIQPGTLAMIYQELCTAKAKGVGVGCTQAALDASFADAIDPFFDGSAIDASDNAGDAGPDNVVDAGDAGDASDDGGGTMWKLVPIRDSVGLGCVDPSDLGRVLADIPSSQLYLTRIRGHIPVGAIAMADLDLAPSSDGDVSQYHQAIAVDGQPPPTSNPSGTCKSAPLGRARAAGVNGYAAAAAAAFIAAAILRRRGRRRGP